MSPIEPVRRQSPCRLLDRLVAGRGGGSSLGDLFPRIAGRRENKNKPCVRPHTDTCARALHNEN